MHISSNRARGLHDRNRTIPRKERRRKPKIRSLKGAAIRTSGQVLEERLDAIAGRR